MKSPASTMPAPRRRRKLQRAELALFATPLLVLVLAFGWSAISRALFPPSAPAAPPAPPSPPPMMLAGHTGGIYAVAFSPDGQVLASGATDKTVKLWDTSTSKLLRTLKGHNHKVLTVAFSRDGKKVLSGSSAATVLHKGKRVDSTLAFSTGSRRMTCGTGQALPFRTQDLAYDSAVKLWDTQTGRLLRTMKLSNRGLYAVALAPDSKTMAIYASQIVDGSPPYNYKHPAYYLELRDVQTGRVLLMMPEDAASAVGHGGDELIFSPDGTMLWLANYRGSSLWNLRTKRLQRSFDSDGKWLKDAAAFSPDGRILARGGHYGRIELRNAHNGAWTRSLRNVNQASGIRALAFSRDGKLLISADWRKLCIWDVKSGELKQTNDVNQTEYSHGEVEVSPDGQVLAGSSAGSSGKPLTLVWRP